MRSFVLGWNVSCFHEILHKSTLLPLSAPLCLYILTNHISLGRGRCVLWCVKWLDGLKRFRSVCRTIPHIINAALRTPLNSWWSGVRSERTACFSVFIPQCFFHCCLEAPDQYFTVCWGTNAWWKHLRQRQNTNLTSRKCFGFNRTKFSQLKCTKDLRCRSFSGLSDAFMLKETLAWLTYRLIDWSVSPGQEGDGFKFFFKRRMDSSETRGTKASLWSSWTVNINPTALKRSAVSWDPAAFILLYFMCFHSESRCTSAFHLAADLHSHLLTTIN